MDSILIDELRAHALLLQRESAAIGTNLREIESIYRNNPKVGSARTEAFLAKAKTQYDINTKCVSDSLKTVESLEKEGFADIDSIHERIKVLPALRLPACQIGTEHSCGKCKHRIFASEEKRDAHLLTVVKDLPLD